MALKFTPKSRYPQFRGGSPFLACSSPVIWNLIPKHLPMVIKPVKLLTSAGSQVSGCQGQPSHSCAHSSLELDLHSHGETGDRQALGRQGGPGQATEADHSLMGHKVLTVWKERGLLSLRNTVTATMLDMSQINSRTLTPTQKMQENCEPHSISHWENPWFHKLHGVVGWGVAFIHFGGPWRWLYTLTPGKQGWDHTVEIQENKKQSTENLSPMISNSLTTWRIKNSPSRCFIQPHIVPLWLFSFGPVWTSHMALCVAKSSILAFVIFSLQPQTDNLSLSGLIDTNFSCLLFYIF